jgi:hypothetical protein
MLNIELPPPIERYFAAKGGADAEETLACFTDDATVWDNGLVVAVVVSGDFPSSPYKFEYRFKLKGDKIAELAIDPIGSLAE